MALEIVGFGGRDPELLGSDDIVGFGKYKIKLRSLTPIKKRWEQTKTFYCDYGLVNVLFLNGKVFKFLPILGSFVHIIYLKWL